MLQIKKSTRRTHVFFTMLTQISGSYKTKVQCQNLEIDMVIIHRAYSDSMYIFFMHACMCVCSSMKFYHICSFTCIFHSFKQISNRWCERTICTVVVGNSLLGHFQTPFSVAKNKRSNSSN